MVLGVVLTNNEVKDIIKLIKSLEKRGILQKRTNKKIKNKKVRLLNFLVSLARDLFTMNERCSYTIS